MQKKNLQKKILFLGISLLVLNIPFTLAFFPGAYKNSQVKQFSELCFEKPSQDQITLAQQRWTCKYLRLGCNPKEKITCDFEKIVTAYSKDPTNYSVMPDMERECYRACKTSNLSYSKVKYHILDSPDCLCTNKDQYTIVLGNWGNEK